MGIEKTALGLEFFGFFFFFVYLGSEKGRNLHSILCSETSLEGRLSFFSILLFLSEIKY